MNKPRYTAEICGKTIQVLDEKGTVAFVCLTSSQRELRSWKPNGGCTTFAPDWRGGIPVAAEVSPDSTKLAVGCTLGYLYVWHIDHRSKPILSVQVGGGLGAVSRIYWTEDSTQAIAGVAVLCPPENKPERADK